MVEEKGESDSILEFVQDGSKQNKALMTLNYEACTQTRSHVYGQDTDMTHLERRNDKSTKLCTYLCMCL